MTKSITQMSVIELGALPKEKREDLFRDAIVKAVCQSIMYGNATFGEALIKLAPSVSKSFTKEALLLFLQKWGNFSYDRKYDKLIFSRQFKPDEWTPEFERRLRKADLKPPASRRPELEAAKPRVIDADKEFRAVLERLLRAIDDPDKTVLHMSLVKKIQEEIYSYARSDGREAENKRGQTLYDRSTKMSTTRASKFAKGA